MEDNKIKVLVLRVGDEPAVEEMTDDLVSMQKLVGGYVETVSFDYCDSCYVICCDEEGKLKGKDFNRTVFGENFVGDIFITKTLGDQFTGLNDTDVEVLKRLL